MGCWWALGGRRSHTSSWAGGLAGAARCWCAAHCSAFASEEELSLQDNTKVCYTGWSQCSWHSTRAGEQELLAGQCRLEKSLYQWEGNEENSFCSRHVSRGEEGNVAEVPAHVGAPWCHGPDQLQAPARLRPHTAVLASGTASPGGEHRDTSALVLSALQGSARFSLIAIPCPRGVS